MTLRLRFQRRDSNDFKGQDTLQSQEILNRPVFVIDILKCLKILKITKNSEKILNITENSEQILNIAENSEHYLSS